MTRQTQQRGALRLRKGAWSLCLRDPPGDDGRRRSRIYQVGTLAQLRTKAAARNEANRLLERMGKAALTGKSIEFERFAKMYRLDQLELLAKSTASSYRSLLKRHIVPHFKAMLLHEITGARPSAFVATLQRAGVDRRSIIKIMGLLGRMLDAAAQMGYAALPLNRHAYKLPAGAAPREERCFTPEESAKVLAGAQWPWRAFYALLACTGLRCSEAIALEWRHVDLIARKLSIRQASTLGTIKPVKSRNSAADVPMTETLRMILQAFHDRKCRELGRPPTGLLLPSPRGGPYWSSGIRRTHFAPLLKKLGIAPAGLHAFRHGHATNLFASGAPAPVVRALLRHGDIRTTMRYTHVTSEDQRRAAAAVDRLLAPKQAAA